MRLDEYTKDEWRSIAMKLKPEWTEQDFDQAWNEFIQMKEQMHDVRGSC